MIIISKCASMPFLIYKRLLIATFFMLCLCSCGTQTQGQEKIVKDIKQFVTDFNKQLPQTLGEDFVFEKIEYDDKHNALVAYFKFPYYSEPNAKSLTFMKQNLLNSLITTELNKLAGMVQKIGGDLLLKIRGNNENEYYDILCSNNEIADVLNGSKSSRQEVLGDVISNMIEITNNNLPNQVDEYCVCTNLSEEKNYLVYNFVVDESLVDFDWYKEGLLSIDEYKQELIKSCSEDPIEKHQYSLLAEVGYGMINRYKGSKSSKSVEIILTPQDIKDISE